ncbi:MAG: serine/threonine protein kinase [Gemmatimonadota bacterium]|nr:MAG: serine/threonine protein kinase [Gemmatimonadota bacterium]
MKTCTTCGAEWPDETKFCPRDGSPLRVAEGTSLIGSIVADTYHILEKLGEGGMGAVYLGEHVKMGRKSAIKVLTQSLAQDSEAIARFNREASNAARINHPNVCAIYDFGETKDGLIFLAMEYIEGESLTDLVRREGPLGPYRAATIVHQVGSALQAAHDLGIVHRDLKPDNVMITKARDGTDMVKVVDFGIAKAMGGEEGQKVTRTGLVVGTPEYMSPEQLSGDKLDGRSDTYSLALVLFKMLTGRLPFEADNAQEIMIKRLTDEPLRLNDALVGANFPGRLQQVMDRALQRMPSDRHASAEAFMREAVQAVQGVPAASVDTEGATQRLGTAPSGPGVTEQLRKTRVSGSKPTLPLDQGAALGARTPETPLPRTVLSPRVKRRKPAVAIAGSLAVVAIGAGALAVVLSNAGESRAGTNDSLRLAANTPVTPIDTGTGGHPDATQGPEASAAQTAPGGEVVTGTERATSEDTTRRIVNPPAAVDPAAANADSIQIENQIAALIDPLIDDNPGVVGEALIEARQLYADPRASPIQQAQLAFMLAGSYGVQGTPDSACTWIDRALSHDPGNSIYQRFRRNNCTP